MLLTSHMMSECEALCNRVGIMVNGSFRYVREFFHRNENYVRIV